jgi:hypothetical protein
VLVAIGAVTAGLLAAGGPLPALPSRRASLLAAGGVLATALAGARLQATLVGDSLFHVGRVRKLLALPELSLSGVSGFEGGELHAGYPFPLLHAAQAGAIDLSGLEPSAAYPQLAPTFAAMVALAAFAAGDAAAGRGAGVVAAVVATWHATTRATEPLGFVQQPGSFTFLVLFPIAFALLVLAVRAPRDRRLGCAVVAAVAVVALVHSSYAVALLAAAAAGAVAFRCRFGTLAAATALTGVVYAAVYLTALAGAPRSKVRTVEDGGFVLWEGRALLLDAERIVQERPEVLVLAVALPVLFVAARGRGALAAAITTGALGLAVIPGAITPLVEALGAGQSRRLAAGVPWYVVAGTVAAVVASAHPARTLAVAGTLAAATVALAVVDLPPAVALGVLVLAGGAAVALAVRGPRADAPRDDRRARWPAVALLGAAVLAGSVVEHGASAAARMRDGLPPPALVHRVTPSLVAFLRSADADLPVVMADPRATRADGFSGVAYELVGRADVYVVAVTDAHNRAEPKNDPQERRRAARRFFALSTSSDERHEIAARYGVDLVVVDGKRRPGVLRSIAATPWLRRVYQDPATPPAYGRFTVFAVEPPS